LVALGFLLGGCASNQAGGAAGNSVTLTGVVKLTDNQTARGFGYPKGYQLTAQSDYEPLLLQHGGSLVDPMFRDFEGHRVQVSGDLSFAERARVETEDYSTNRRYWILDVKTIRLAE
jgi:hypothetical protein